MKMKKITFMLATGIFLVACYLLYTSLDAANARKKETYEKEKQEIENLEDKLKHLEADLQKNENLINDIRGNIYKVIGGSRGPGRIIRPITSMEELKNAKKSASSSSRAHLSTGTCNAFKEYSGSTGDVQMLDMYQMMGFENPDGGAWKQGWNIQYDKESVEKTKPRLEVIVIPHSHCDPGWIKTFEKYYQDQTRHILDNMVAKLSADNKLRFIYAEISFFELWWRQIDDVKRNAVRKILENGQFEIATGGWVMTDEANSHYFAMIDQMIEGHQWLENHLGYKPKNHWSIDPFGLSPTMAYMLRRANFSTMTIQRVHYAVKKQLAQKKFLEFMWRQLWAEDKETDILTHMFPFYSYDVPHTCGPDPKICCQFDFKRLPGGSVGCPWNIPPSPITEFNIQERAETLLDQYRKKAELYQTNVLLVPLGDDFRYDTAMEWDAQSDNYQKLFAHMNARSDWNVHARFGTLDDYFKALRERTKSEVGSKPEGFPVLSGDFFTYADRDDHYWSGYFTTRPLHKRLDRVLIHYLRGAEIAYSLSIAILQKYKVAGYPFEELFTHLVRARRNLALFQHHDGITGTAKDHVVVDYGTRMLQSIQLCRDIISASVHLMLTQDKSTFHTELSALAFDIDERRATHESLAEKVVISVAEQPRSLVFYNSLPQERREVVCIRTDTRNLELRNSAGERESAQMNPVIYRNNGKLDISAVVYEVCLEVRVPALGVSQYSIRSADNSDSVTLAKLKANFGLQSSVFQTDQFSTEDDGFTMESQYFGARFSKKTGYLQRIQVAGEPQPRRMELEFVHYGTTKAKDKSGAYLFLPAGPAKAISSTENQVILVDGPLISTVTVQMPVAVHSMTLTKIHSIEGESLRINNVVNIKQEYNYELAMRIKSDIANKDRVFYTDLNGFQMIKRKFFSKIPLQGNFYPLPTAAFIEDDRHRLSLLSGQPLGVANLEAGWLEVILDRRLMQDDNRGLFQGITDNRVTPDTFRLILEPLASPSTSGDFKIGHNTLLAHHTSAMLLHPIFTYFRKEIHQQPELLPGYSALSRAFPCDVELVNLKTLEMPQDYAASGAPVKPQKEQALLLRRFVVDCRSSLLLPLKCNSTEGEIPLEHLFSDTSVRSAFETSLTLMYTGRELSQNSKIKLNPMDLSTFRVTLQ